MEGIFDWEQFENSFSPATKRNMARYTFDWEQFENSFSPATKRNMARRSRVITLHIRILRWCPWMNTSFMSYITAFWTGLVDEGPYQLLKPRWGGITFGWLNDGIKPTVWHTLYSLFIPRGKYSAIYPEGAPRSLADARRIDCETAEGRHESLIYEMRPASQASQRGL